MDLKLQESVSMPTWVYTVYPIFPLVVNHMDTRRYHFRINTRSPGGYHHASGALGLQLWAPDIPQIVLRCGIFVTNSELRTQGVKFEAPNILRHCRTS